MPLAHPNVGGYRVVGTHRGLALFQSDSGVRYCTDETVDEIVYFLDADEWRALGFDPDEFRALVHRGDLDDESTD